MFMMGHISRAWVERLPPRPRVIGLYCCQIIVMQLEQKTLGAKNWSFLRKFKVSKGQWAHPMQLSAVMPPGAQSACCTSSSCITIVLPRTLSCRRWGGAAGSRWSLLIRFWEPGSTEVCSSGFTDKIMLTKTLLRARLYLQLGPALLCQTQYKCLALLESPKMLGNVKAPFC